ncbi:MAG TPA: multicopper oxidase domain-containing protein, partial [Candidatus Krumholzibacteria bacterium]|nr:multicopper oxidase domain-containing protein [Candidatus Krumholzibacteria bacterium]
FTADGQLFYPSAPAMPGQPDPSHLPEFFGDFILVNSAPWPILDVEPRQYRFRMLNGSDSRFYELWLQEKTGNDAVPIKAALPSMYQIGTDTGLLNAPVALTRFVIGTGERADMVFDFSDPTLWGKTFILRNSGKTPFPKGSAVNPVTAGQVMAFRISKPLDTTTYPATTLPANLRPLHGPVGMPVANADTRELILFEGTDEYGRLQAKLGTLDGALAWQAPITENPMVNDTEVWEIYNTTADAHPIHLHLVSFRIVDRQRFKADVDPVTGRVSNVRLVGRPMVPPAREDGWKDTAVMFPGEVTRVVATFDREGLYVWHCHILSHEDHEMMRPYYVRPMAGAPEAAVADTPLRIASVTPNPFNPSTRIHFEVSRPLTVQAAIYDVAGRLVRRFDDRAVAAGAHVLEWNGSTDAGASVATGVYFLQLRAGSAVETRRLVMIK